MATDYCKISLKKLTGKQARPGYHNTEFKNLFGSLKLDPCLPFSRFEFFQDSREKTHGMSISGVQQKLSLKENDQQQLLTTVEGGQYILKPSPEAYPHAAENEHAAMLVSRLMGIETAQCCLVSFSDGELAYITRRFDREKDGGKLHQEDLMQCFNLPSDDKYSKTYEDAGKLIHQVTNGKQSVVLEFVRRIILAYVVGNDDLHLKNLSVQRLAGNKGYYYDKLTPSYDCLFCDAFKSTESETSGMGLLALGLLNDPEHGDEYFTDSYKHYGYYTSCDFLMLGNRLNLPEKPIRTFMTKLKNNENKIINMIDCSYMPEHMKCRASERVRQGIQAVLA